MVVVEGSVTKADKHMAKYGGVTTMLTIQNNLIYFIYDENEEVELTAPKNKGSSVNATSLTQLKHNNR